MCGNRQGQKDYLPDSAPDTSFLKKISSFTAKEGRTKKNMPGTKSSTYTLCITACLDVCTKALNQATEMAIWPHCELFTCKILWVFSLKGEELPEHWLKGAACLESVRCQKAEKQRC